MERKVYTAGEGKPLFLAETIIHNIIYPIYNIFNVFVSFYSDTII